MTNALRQKRFRDRRRDLFNFYRRKFVKKLFAIYDSQTELFGQPIIAINKGDVLRQFTIIVNDGQSQYAKHPNDFALFELGDYDESTGKITELLSPTRVCLAKELLSPKE